MAGAHKCEQESTACNNTLGGYTCQCKNGYQPAQSLYKCQGDTDEHLFHLCLHSWDKKKTKYLTPQLAYDYFGLDKQTDSIGKSVVKQHRSFFEETVQPCRKTS